MPKPAQASYKPAVFPILNTETDIIPVFQISIPVYSGIEGFSRNIPLPLKKSGFFDVKTAVKCIQTY
jgi:hypothetical protein